MTTPTWPVASVWPDLPAEGPASAEAVTAEAGPIPAADAALVESTVDAVNAAVRTWNCAALAVGQAAWPDDIVKGANMLAMRLYRRRNSPGGVESFGDLGPVYVNRRDPDIAMLLHIGSHAYPQIG
jgi:hypothetical protein